MSIFNHDHNSTENVTANPLRLFVFMALVLIVLVGIAAGGGSPAGHIFFKEIHYKCHKKQSKIHPHAVYMLY